MVQQGKENSKLVHWVREIETPWQGPLMSLACDCSCIQLCVGPKGPSWQSLACFPDDLGFLQTSPASGCEPSLTTPVHENILSLYLPHTERPIYYTPFPSRSLNPSRHTIAQVVQGREERLPTMMNPSDQFHKEKHPFSKKERKKWRLFASTSKHLGPAACPTSVAGQNPLDRRVSMSPSPRSLLYLLFVDGLLLLLEHPPSL